MGLGKNSRKHKETFDLYEAPDGWRGTYDEVAAHEASLGLDRLKPGERVTTVERLFQQAERAWATDERKRFKLEHPWCSFFEVSHRPGSGVVALAAVAWGAVLWPLTFLALVGAGAYSKWARGDGTLASGAALVFVAHEVSRRVLKQRFRQLRPEESLASTAWGMPSNHSVVAACELTLALGHVWAEGLPAWPYAVAPLILCAPVPLSRVVLGDHTPGQAMAGTCFGTFVAAVFILAKVEASRGPNPRIAQ
jgi:membrane-associated phospholipid phosphatase